MKISNQELSTELLGMMEKDQRSIKDGFANYRKVNAENTLRLKEIIKNHGWPTISMVGRKAAQAAWLIAQHSDHDVAFQKQALKLMESLYKKGRGEVEKQHIAYLTDRVLRNQGKKQRFGTQLAQDEESGQWSPHPLEDPKNIDTWRHEYDLPPLKDYIKTHTEFHENQERSK